MAELAAGRCWALLGAAGRWGKERRQRGGERGSVRPPPGKGPSPCLGQRQRKSPAGEQESPKAMACRPSAGGRAHVRSDGHSSASSGWTLGGTDAPAGPGQQPQSLPSEALLPRWREELLGGALGAVSPIRACTSAGGRPGVGRNGHSRCRVPAGLGRLTRPAATPAGRGELSGIPETCNPRARASVEAERSFCSRRRHRAKGGLSASSRGK